MVDMTDPENPVTKVIDFGFAAQSTQKLQVFCGTPAYMSPEICAKQAYDGPLADIWAAGVLLYTMLFGHQPFRAPNEKELFKKIQKGHYNLPSTALMSVEDLAAASGTPMKSPQSGQLNFS